MEELLAIVSDANRYMYGAGAERPDALLLKKGAVYVTRMLRIFGVAVLPEFGLPTDDDADTNDTDAGAPIVDALAAFRDSVRAGARAAGGAAAADLLGLCDQLRDSTLVDLGIRLEDRPDGAVWRRDDPAEMRRELEAKAAAALEAAASKLARKLEGKRAEIIKEREAAVPPAELFLQPKYAAKYSPNERDADGKPTLTVDGELLTKSAKKDVDKVYNKQAKEYEKHLERLAKTPDLFAALETGLGALYAEAETLVNAHRGELSPELLAQLTRPGA